MTTASSAPAHMIDHPTELLSSNLATAVEGVLWEYEPIRMSNSALRVTAVDGAVTLSGNVVSTTMKHIAGRLVERMPEVTSVVNDIRADPEIDRAVATAIAMDPDIALYTDTLHVKCLRGSLYLSGVVTAPELEQAEAAISRAVEIAAGIEGVREVLNGVEAAVGLADDAVTAKTDAAVTTDTSAADKAAMDERMATWRERAAAKG